MPSTRCSRSARPTEDVRAQVGTNRNRQRSSQLSFLARATPPDVRLMNREADAAARRLTRKLRGNHDQIDDVRQELLVDLIWRMPAFDSRRGSLGAFAGRIMANKATRIGNTARRHGAVFGVAPVSLDEPHPEVAGCTLGDVVAENDGYGALVGQRTDPFLEADRRLDVARCLAVLSERDRKLCASLARSEIDELVDQGEGTRSSLYRRVGRIRLDLTSAGLGGAAS